MRHQAFAAAKDKTHIVVCLGEPWNWSGESKVRLMPKVPDLQVRFVEQLREATAADIIVLITAGRQLKIPDAVQRCAQAVFWAPQLGTFAGTAVANVLSGRKNPSGRLAYSLPCHEAVTSGFSHRERRIGRPAAFTNRATREYATPGLSAHYQELGPRNSLAEFHFGEGYSYTSFELWIQSSAALRSAYGATSHCSRASRLPTLARVRVRKQCNSTGTIPLLKQCHAVLSCSISSRWNLCLVNQGRSPLGLSRICSRSTVAPWRRAQSRIPTPTLCTFLSSKMQDRQKKRFLPFQRKH